MKMYFFNLDRGKGKSKGAVSDAERTDTEIFSAEGNGKTD